jgi:hypothetical protein
MLKHVLHGSSGDSESWLVKVADMKVDTTQSQAIISDKYIPDNNISDKVDTTQSQIIITDNNVTDNIQTSPGKSMPGFEFFGGVFSSLIILFSRRRIL